MFRVSFADQVHKTITNKSVYRTVRRHMGSNLTMAQPHRLHSTHCHPTPRGLRSKSREAAAGVMCSPVPLLCSTLLSAAGEINTSTRRRSHYHEASVGEEAAGPTRPGLGSSLAGLSKRTPRV
jgi:hypothetical protein